MRLSQSKSDTILHDAMNQGLTADRSPLPPFPAASGATQNRTTRKAFSITLILLAVGALTGCVVDDESQIDEPDLAEQSDEIVQGAVAKRPHCVMAAVAQREGEARRAVMKAATPRCYETFSDAIFAATDGRVRIAPSVTAETLDEQALGGDTSGAFAPYVLGVEYEHGGFGGATMTLTGASSCIGTNWVLPYASFPPGWNDIISSARAFSGCNNSYHYEHDFTGAVVNCGTECSWIGDAMNDRTSSIMWTQ
jgi:hypothetical protein